MNISEYIKLVDKTDKLPKETIDPILLGLYGETGELLTIAKKKRREETAFTNSQYNADLVEGIGDAFWYLCCLTIRLKLNFQAIFSKISDDEIDLIKNDFLLFEIGKLAGNFLGKNFLHEQEKISLFLVNLLALAKANEIDFELILQENKKKISSRFIPFDKSKLPDFDEDYEEAERLPSRFEIEYVKKGDKKQALRWNGVFIGDPLSDNSYNDDGYRFHDVFHLSYAAILHWSPVFRALIQHKRKSNSIIDETQDGGRARVIEEGISTWIFSVAKEEEYFEGRNSLTFSMLKTIVQMVKGLEVEKCPMSLWEEAVLKGYKVFRQVKENGGGIVIGDRECRTISYQERNKI